MREGLLISTEDILEQTAKQDPWAGLGMTFEELASKVEGLENDNEELAAGADGMMESYRRRLVDAAAGA